MDSSWWICERCLSVNHPATSACYSCRTPRGQQSPAAEQQSVPAATAPGYQRQALGPLPSAASYAVPPAPPYAPAIGPSQGYVVAGMPGRVGAWILDGLLVGLLSLVPVVIALVSGAVTLNQQALDQIGQIQPDTAQPFSSVTVPIISVNFGLLVAAAAVFIAIHVLYYAWGWIEFGGTLAQRALKLRVADNASGANLSVDQALMRWLLLEGISTITGAVFLILFLNAAATTPLNQLFGLDTNIGTSGYRSFGVTIVSDIVSWGSSLWLIVLAISAGASSVHRGLHDRMVGSIVVRPAPAYAGWSGYGYPTQAMPYGPSKQWPGYPPQSNYPTAPGSAPRPYPGYGPSAGMPTSGAGPTAQQAPSVAPEPPPADRQP